MKGAIARLAVAVAIAAGAMAPGGPVRAADEPDKEIPVLFTADELEHNRELGSVIARGNVEVEHEDRVLRADVINYNTRTDVLSAIGNVTLMEPSGEVVFADYVELTSDLRDGIVKGFKVLLEDGSRLVAASGRRIGAGARHELSHAVYSACNLCPDDPTAPPLWQIKAIKVVHDRKRRAVEYTDAWLELAGIPIVYTPYLEHPDPTVGRESGFLPPSIGSSTSLGFMAEVPYYFNIAPDMDATVIAKYFTKEGPLIFGEYRQLLTDGEFKVEASLTEDSDDEVRGHLRSEGRFDIDDTWRWGFDIDRASDDTYLRRYNFGSKSTLTSRVYAEGFRRRNYLLVDSYAFQGLEKGDRVGKTPYVFPLVEFQHVGEPNGMGARTSLDASVVALTRTDGTDTRRISVKPGWTLPYISPLGDIYSLSATLQGDLYHVADHSMDGGTDEFNGFAARVIPELAVDWRYPFVRSERNAYQLIEPIASLIVSPYGGNPAKIPNEDSEDFEFDDTNLFSAKRFTGFDRVEGGPRVNYGLRWGLFGETGGTTTVLVGQSYRLKADDTFAEGSGLEGNFSDIVGRLHVSPGEYLDLYYRTRLDRSNFSPRRNEVELSVGPSSLRFDAGYVFFDRQEGSEFAAREELDLSITAQLSRYWQGRLWGVRDLTSDGGTRKVGLNLTYEDECLEFSSDFRRTFFRDRDLEPDDSFTFRVNFKTIGEVKI